MRAAFTHSVLVESPWPVFAGPSLGWVWAGLAWAGTGPSTLTRLADSSHAQYEKDGEVRARDGRELA
eukprot:8121957-Heterocapsa_arctica.AAC.1